MPLPQSTAIADAWFQALSTAMKPPRRNIAAGRDSGWNNKNANEAFENADLLISQITGAAQTIERQFKGILNPEVYDRLVAAGKQERADQLMEGARDWILAEHMETFVNATILKDTSGLTGPVYEQQEDGRLRIIERDIEWQGRTLAHINADGTYELFRPDQD